MSLDKKSLKKILSLCDYCKECINPCPISGIDPSNNHSPLIKIKLADLIYRDEKIPQELIEDLTYCTTCGICNEHCAPHIDVLKLIQELRSWAQSSKKIEVPKWDEFVLKIQNQGNPYGKNSEEKLEVLKQYDSEIAQPDFYFYFGCTLPLKFFKESENILKILKKLELKFKIIDIPICCGGILSRIGKSKEYEKNKDKWKKLIKKNTVKEIVVLCPGCYSIIIKIIEELKINVKVSHLFEKIIPLLPIINQNNDENIELHLSCHLHLHNPELYKQLATKLPLLNIPETRKCCGAGGGFIGSRPEEAKRIGKLLLQEKAEQNLNSIITECPFCYYNLLNCNANINVIYLFDYLLDYFD